MEIFFGHLPFCRCEVVAARLGKSKEGKTEAPQVPLRN
jgi:hypothetical protein